MKTYKLLKELPWLSIWSWFVTRNDNGIRVYAWMKCLGMILEIALSEWWRLEEKKDYIVTEEGEIIGEYKWKCWFLNYIRVTCQTNYVSDHEVGHFITEEQCNRRKIKEFALRKIWQLYYENWYEENKGEFEAYYSVNSKYINNAEIITNTSLPHCNSDFHNKMLNIPEIEALYLTYFWIDESRGT